MLRRVNVILIDEHNTCREGFAWFLQKYSFKVIFSSNRSRKGLDKAITKSPDLAIVDYKTTQHNTIKVAYQIKEQLPGIKLIFHSVHFPTANLKELKTIGDGLLVKSAFEIKTGLRLISNVLKSPVAEGYTFGASSKWFWILTPHLDTRYVITDIAVAAIRKHELMVPLLMNAFERNQETIKDWLNTKDPRLLTPQTIDIISKWCKLTVSEIMEDSYSKLYQVN